MNQYECRHTRNVHGLVFDGDDVNALVLGGEVDTVVEVVLVHHLAQFRLAIGVRDGRLHVERVCA